MKRTPRWPSSVRKVRSAAVRVESGMPQPEPQALTRGPLEVLEGSVNPLLIPSELRRQDACALSERVVTLDPCSELFLRRSVGWRAHRESCTSLPPTGERGNRAGDAGVPPFLGNSIRGWDSSLLAAADFIECERCRQVTERVDLLLKDSDLLFGQLDRVGAGDEP